jgi:hypothetical protein
LSICPTRIFPYIVVFAWKLTPTQAGILGTSTRKFKVAAIAPLGIS